MKNIIKASVVFMVIIGLVMNPLVASVGQAMSANIVFDHMDEEDRTFFHDTVDGVVSIAVLWGLWYVFVTRPRARRESNRQAGLDLYLEANPDREEFRSAISNNRVVVGMNTEEVRQSWGSPSTINRREQTRSVSEQWVYRDSNPRNTRYVHFTNGYVGSVHTSR